VSKGYIIGGAVWVVEVIAYISAMFLIFAPGEFAQWLATLLATLMGAALAAASGVWLFYYQGKQSEGTRVEYLREGLIGELYATRDRLQTEPEQRVPHPTGNGPDVVVVLAHLEPTMCEEVMRSALFGHVNTSNLTYLARLMREYTKAADLLRSSINRPHMDDPLLKQHWYDQAKSVKNKQEFTIMFCDTILEGFESQGIKLPPEEKYFSDPSRQAPEDFIRYDQ
jgi:hypothetical protein